MQVEHPNILYELLREDRKLNYPDFCKWWEKFKHILA